MKRTVWGFVLLAAASVTGLIWAQGQYPVMPRGQATDIKKASLDSLLATMLASGKSVNDEVIRTFNMNNTHHVEVALLHYAVSKPTDKPTTTAPEHAVVSELYYTIKGSGTLVTGGTMENVKAADLNNAGTKQLFGPGWSGTFKDVVKRKISEGDVTVIPPNTPHNIFDVTSDMEILVIRIDPSKMLELK
jgi:mannose-6-phosphate isomerase-like protein (cupin superfamily)